MIEIIDKALAGYKFIDLFCGIGGFHLALESFGAECVFASDINPEACKVYKDNFGIEPLGDITKIDIGNIPDHDIICAGFPCQPFSISGKKDGFKDKKRGNLFYNVVKIARVHRPSVILLENVRNFENHNNGKTMSRVRESLNGIGYTVYSKVLCASDYGVPQARKRIYIVAFRNDLNINAFTFPEGLANYVTVNDILIDDDKNEIDGIYDVKRDDLAYNEIDDDNVNNLKRIGSKGLGRQGERIYSIHGQSTTLSSQGGGIAGKTGMYLINNAIRKLYPRECARLMGFPDDFHLANTQEQCYKQFGNSVVVDVLQYIMINIIKVL